MILFNHNPLNFYPSHLSVSKQTQQSILDLQNYEFETDLSPPRLWQFSKPPLLHSTSFKHYKSNSVMKNEYITINIYIFLLNYEKVLTILSIVLWRVIHLAKCKQQIGKGHILLSTATQQEDVEEPDFSKVDGDRTRHNREKSEHERFQLSIRKNS